MKKMKCVDYECGVCGTHITVHGDGSGQISPIYCCDFRVSEISGRKAATKRKPAEKSAEGKPSSANRSKTVKSVKTASPKKAVRTISPKGKTQKRK